MRKMRRGTWAVPVYAARNGPVAPLLEMSQKDWDLVLGVNLTGAWNVVTRPGDSSTGRAEEGCREFLHRCSAACRRSCPVLRRKAGLESLVRVAAHEVAPRGVRVNAVAPGCVVTPLMAKTLEEPAVPG